MDCEMTEDNNCEKMILKAALSEAASPASGEKEPEFPYGEQEGAPVLTVRSVLQQGQGSIVPSLSSNQLPENGSVNRERQNLLSKERNTDRSDDFDIVISDSDDFDI